MTRWNADVKKLRSERTTHAISVIVGRTSCVRTDGKVNNIAGQFSRDTAVDSGRRRHVINSQEC